MMAAYENRPQPSVTWARDSQESQEGREGTCGTGLFTLHSQQIFAV